MIYEGQKPDWVPTANTLIPPGMVDAVGIVGSTALYEPMRRLYEYCMFVFSPSACNVPNKRYCRRALTRHDCFDAGFTDNYKNKSPLLKLSHFTEPTQVMPW